MIYLRASTASQEVALGPFVDSTDGVTAETALTIANTDIKIWKRGATTLADKNSGGATHMAQGVYVATFDDTDTNTEGSGAIFVGVAGALPVRHDFSVLNASMYDALLLDDLSLVGPVPNLGILESGTAQSGTATTLVLRAATEDFADDVLNGATIAIRGSTQGYWQTRAVNAYDQATKTVTFDALGVTATGTIYYRIYSTPPASLNSPVQVDVVRVSGDSAAADNLEAMLDGTGGVSLTATLAGNVTGSVDSVANPTITGLSLSNAAIDAILTRAFPAESYAADGALPTLVQSLLLIQQYLTEKTIDGTSVVIKKLDGSTPALTLTLNDPDRPTSNTRSG